MHEEHDHPHVPHEHFAHRVPRLGIGGPVGSGKTALIEQIVPRLADEGLQIGIVTNDIVTKEDAIRLQRTLSCIREEGRIVGVETGTCPHTAIREDPTLNLQTLREMEAQFPDLDLIIVESGGDNLAATYSKELADYFVFVIDVAAGDDIPRKDGPGISRCDLLVINKPDLAPYVGADLEVIRRDSERVRRGAPFLFTNCKTGEGVDEVIRAFRQRLLPLRVPRLDS